MKFNPELMQAHDSLTLSLNLRQPPVAISFADFIPDGVASPSVPVAAGCRFWQDGAVSTFATSASDHGLCSIGLYTHNLELSHSNQTDLGDALKVFSDLGYVRKEDLPLIPVLQSRSKYIVYSPLRDAPLPPDVVILFVNANQTLILSEATQQLENQHPPAMGRPACGVVPEVMNTGRAALSLGCCGARAYLDVLTDDVAVFAIPGAKLAIYTERIGALANANAMLSSFHRMRRESVMAGQSPSIQESLAAFSAS